MDEEYPINTSLNIFFHKWWFCRSGSFWGGEGGRRGGSSQVKNSYNGCIHKKMMFSLKLKAFQSFVFWDISKISIKSVHYVKDATGWNENSPWRFSEGKGWGRRRRQASQHSHLTESLQVVGGAGSPKFEHSICRWGVPWKSVGSLYV